MKLQGILLLTALHGAIMETFGQTGETGPAELAQAQYIDPEEVSKPLCGSDIGKDCAGLVYCAKKPSSILNQCTQCANDNAVTNGFKTTRADCSRCAGDLKSKDPARKQSAIAFDDGYKKQLTKLGIECSDSILSNYGKEEPTVGLDPNFVDSSYECSCRDACRTYPPSWIPQGTPDVCCLVGGSGLIDS